MWNIAAIALAASFLFGIQFATRYIRARRLKYWFEQGMTCYKAREFSGALPAFRKCVRLAPEWLHARTFMSISLAQTGQHEEALREIDMVQTLQPREAETWTLITTFFLLCMPDEEKRLFDALDRLAELDAYAVNAIISQPAFNRYHDSPQLSALRRRLSTTG